MNHILISASELRAHVKEELAENEKAQEDNKKAFEREIKVWETNTKEIREELKNFLIHALNQYYGVGYSELLAPVYTKEMLQVYLGFPPRKFILDWLDKKSAILQYHTKEIPRFLKKPKFDFFVVLPTINHKINFPIETTELWRHNFELTLKQILLLVPEKGQITLSPTTAGRINFKYEEKELIYHLDSSF